jgi:hypothetical protein
VSCFDFLSPQATISSVLRHTEIGFIQQSLMWKNTVCGLLIPECNWHLEWTFPFKPSLPFAPPSFIWSLLQRWWPVGLWHRVVLYLSSNISEENTAKTSGSKILTTIYRNMRRGQHPQDHNIQNPALWKLQIFTEFGSTEVRTFSFFICSLWWQL